MKKTILCLTLVGLIATPAVADLTPSAYEPTLGNLTPTGEGTVGVYNPHPYTPGLYYWTWKCPYTTSDIFHVSFGFHWPFLTSVHVEQAWFGLSYDNSEVTILNMVGAGNFAGGANNFPPPTMWSGPTLNPSFGTVQIGDVLGTGVPLWANPGALSHWIGGSDVWNFVGMDVHVKDVNPDSLVDLLCPSFALLYRTSTTATQVWWTGGVVGENHYGMGVVPEAGSLALLGLGIAALSMGWQRAHRRRCGR